MSRTFRQDRVREFAVWLLYSSAFNTQTTDELVASFEHCFLGPVAPPSAEQASEFFALPRMEDELPDSEEWMALRTAVETLVQSVIDGLEQVDALISEASPRWRIERMNRMDLTLLRVGVAELIFPKEVRSRGTINGMIELAKRYGSDRSPGFVNGLLDQVRRNQGIEFK